MFNLVPWKKKNQQNEITRFREGMDSLFSEFWNGSLFPRAFSDEFGAFPSVDVTETKDRIKVKAEVPGVDPKDIDISIQGRDLVISGEKQEESEDRADNYHVMERSYGSFRRRIHLPKEVDDTDVDATCKKGVLKVILKKRTPDQSKRIEVKPA